ncbi:MULTISPECIES: LuxR C-terminal-related transcriptional regulator [Frankia]|uniref:LuxR-family transcriptional regulator n=1 Tax=Frankia alni (strain DSM 45986 / CECT 9034 / ACN14a) TaxID=326424 RepID=Q0RHJ1_FRAAA|nr:MULTISPECIES: LuxR C-terminal-related transcriptional regulator [Frankia]CAJ63035.1 Putative luxR-family transcriptional regulator [Frankia alni ACN14a]
MNATDDCSDLTSTSAPPAVGPTAPPPARQGGHDPAPEPVPGKGRALDILGLDDDALSAYRLWLRHGSLSVSEAAQMLGEPAGGVGRIRDRLVELGLLLASRDRPGRFVAVHPEAGLDHLLQAQHEQLIRRHERLVRARAQVSVFVSDYLEGRPGPDTVEVQRIDGVDQARAELLTLVGRAEREVLTLRTRRGWSAALSADVMPVELRALRRGVVMRSVLPRSLRLDERGAGYVRTVAAHGLDARVTDDPRLDATTIDGRVGLVRLARGGIGTGGHTLLVRTPELTAVLLTLFEQVWEIAEPLGGGSTQTGGEESADDPSDTERLLLRLLSLGVKDEAAARHLGVSVRTVRRMIADLMSRLDARSRFQAGTLASRRGWL